MKWTGTLYKRLPIAGHPTLVGLTLALIAVYVHGPSATAEEVLFSASTAISEPFENAAWFDRSAVASDGQGNWVIAWWQQLPGSSDYDIMMAQYSEEDPAKPVVPVPLNAYATTDDGDDRQISVGFGNGTWVAAWETNVDFDEGISTDWDIACARGTLGEDGSLTWSPPEAVNSNAKTDIKIKGKKIESTCTDLKPRLATDGGGNWVAIWNRSGSDTGGETQLVASFYENDGATWSQEVVVSAGRYEWEYDLEYGSGTWIIASRGLSKLYVYASSDGMTWSEEVAVDAGYADGGLDVTTDGKGNWMAVCEDGDSDRIVFTKFPDNDGQWSAAQTISKHEDPNRDEQVPSVAVDQQGNWIVAFNCYNCFGDLFGPDDEIFTYRSSDFGESWVGPIVAPLDALHDSNADCAVNVRKGLSDDWLVVWNSMPFELLGSIGGICTIDLAVAEFPPPLGTPGISIGLDYEVFSSEDGTSDVLSVALDSVEPDVVPGQNEKILVPIAAYNQFMQPCPDEIAVSPAELTFTNADFHLDPTLGVMVCTEKSVEVTGVPDGEPDGPQAFIIQVGPASALSAVTEEPVASQYDGVCAEPVYGLNLDASGNSAPTAGFTYAVIGLTVDFTDTSTDADGTLVSWDWDFGDGNASVEQNPSHTYDAAGIYTVTLTVTDDGGATDTFSQTVAADEPNDSTLYVGSIVMDLERAGVNYEAVAAITLLDSAGGGASEATVTGEWTLNSGFLSTVSGQTNGEGIVELRSPKRKASSGDCFTFTVTDIEKAGSTYDASSNIETTDTIDVP